MKERTEKKNWIKTIVILMTLITPIFTRYALPILPGISMFDLILVFAFGLGLMVIAEDMKFDAGILLFTIYVLARQLISGIGGGVSSSDLDMLGGLHVMIYYVFGVVVVFNLKRIHNYESLVHVVATLITIFLLLQVLVYSVAGYYIDGTLRFLVHDSVSDRYAASVNSVRTTLRPRSVFIEPSHYGVYVALALALVIDYQNETKKAKYLSLLYSVGLIASLSTTGIFLCLALWGMYAIRALRKRKLKRNTIIIIGMLIVPLAISFVYFLNSDWLAFFLRRTFGIGAQSWVNSALYNRIGSIGGSLRESESVMVLFVGEGYKQREAFLPEIVTGVLNLGVLGVGLLWSSVRRRFKRGITVNNIIMICFLVSCIGSLLLSAFAPYLFITLEMAKDKQTQYESKG